MGKEKKVSNLNNWVPLHTSGFEDGLVREQNTGREGERKTYVLDPYYSTKNEEAIYKFRQNPKAPLVAAYASEVVKDVKARFDIKDKKAEKERKKNVYITAITEHIPHLLSNSPQLTFPESLYVLDRSLEGYEVAYNRVGPMNITDRMIGFTPEGYTKVWINEDFANNHPSYPIKILESTREDSSTFLEGKSLLPVVRRDETQFVENIIDVIGNHTEEGRYPEPFESSIHLKGLGFRDARELIRHFAISHNIWVPDRIDFWHNKCWGWRQVKTVNTYVPPVTTTTVVRQEPIHGYRFNYLPPEHAYEPEIFASRLGEHGIHHGHRY